MIDVHVFDNIIDLEYQHKIKQLFLSSYFPWYFVEDVSTTGYSFGQSRNGFFHNFVMDEKVNSDYHLDILPLIEKSLNKVDYKFTKIIRGRTFFQLPLKNIKNRNIVDTPHIDMDEDHVVVLYYVMDNEARTIIYEDDTATKIKKTIKPKQGRVVIFNGKYWHTAEQPKKNKRCIINYDIV